MSILENNLLSVIVWDPQREIFSWNIPLLGRPILWYGVLFAVGFLFGFLALSSLLRSYWDSKKQIREIAEQFLLFIGIGAIAGARLGDVLFYQDPQIWLQPLEVFYVWKGGLSSHGAAIGTLIALVLLSRHLRKMKHIRMNFLRLLDLTVISAALIGAFIRIGNFINQEILGKETNLPWGVLFLHPADGGKVVVRHPVQLYESLAYLAIFFLLFWLFKTKNLYKQEGKISGLFLVLVFGFRFIIEFFKEEQSELLASGFPLTMGQLLSIPLIIGGICLLLKKSR